MPRIIPTFPDLPAHRQTLTLDGEPYQIRLVWRERLDGWYMDLLGADGETIVLGRRLSPQSLPLYGQTLPDGPPGVFLVRGPPYYRRKALGQTVVIKYFSVGELPESDIDRDYTVVLS